MSGENTKNWVVVGGGMLGLATAWKLLERGQEVTILEAAKDLGDSQVPGAWGTSPGISSIM